MLSVGESARQLGVSPSRVRALIKEGRLPAAKNGREWVLREEDVLQRLMTSPRAGRPRGGVIGISTEYPGASVGEASADRLRKSADATCAEAVACAHGLYDECRRAFGHLPATEVMEAARSREEASFYMAVFDFFLQQRQRELVKEGVF